ncbi:MAG: hypothetical protein ABIH67_04420 [Candidatus Uhrbacteria bacterium]
MGQQKSEFISAFGTAWEIWKTIVEAVMSVGGSDDDLRRLLSDSERMTKVAQMIVSGNEDNHKSFPITINYNQTLKQMIAAGKYDWTNPDIIAKNFPIQGKGEAVYELILVHLNRQATTRQVEEHLATQGLEPVRIEHLLAFGAANPNVQRQFPIIALGSGWVSPRGRRGVPFLDRNGSLRDLNLDWGAPGNHWDASCRFLALRKVQPSGS